MSSDKMMTQRSTDGGLQKLATGRDISLFAKDVADQSDRLNAAICGKRILMIGAAGSIGSHTLMQIAGFGPAALHVVDHNENGLAELVRQMRSQPDRWTLNDFQTLPIDYGSAAMGHFMKSQPGYDAVLNFAALKHVRSEKDPFSTLQMFETNLTKQARLIGWLKETGFKGRLFTVSTDKAANPASMMGASKRVMEHVLFHSAGAQALGCEKTSARFANVAFSNGSLPQAFQFRLERGEPLAVPADTRRYFVSLEESGEICILAAFLAPDQTIAIPRLNPDDHLIPMQDVAEEFLRHHGYEPALYDDEVLACRSVEPERQQGRWPLLVTPLNTAGEKPYEEFSTDEETIIEFGLESLKAVVYLPAQTKRIEEALSQLQLILDGTANAPLDKDRLKAIIAHVEPGFLQTHRDSDLNLDERL